MKKRQEILDDIEQAFGFVPGWLGEMPDEVLDHYWTNHVWHCSDSKISHRDKALIGLGAAVAIHCGYRTAFHSAQLKLMGYDEEQLKEASWVVHTTAGASAYLYGVGYNLEKFNQELETLVDHIIKSHSK